MDRYRKGARGYDNKMAMIRHQMEVLSDILLVFRGVFHR